MDYFPHDCDAAGDEKVEALTSLYGAAGYAFYFILLERIYRTEEFELDVSDAETIQILSKKALTTAEHFNKMLVTALKVGCFDRGAHEARGVLTSNGIKRRASVVIEKREKMRNGRSQGDSAAEMGEQTPPQTPQSKAKESREEESIAVKDSVERRSASTEKELRSKDFILRCDENEFKVFCQTIRSLIAKENQCRRNNPFQWNPTTGTFESDMRNLIYKLADTEKLNILQAAHNILNGAANWTAYVEVCVRYTVRKSVEMKMADPFRFTKYMLNRPFEIASALADGILSTRGFSTGRTSNPFNEIKERMHATVQS